MIGGERQIDCAQHGADQDVFEQVKVEVLQLAHIDEGLGLLLFAGVDGR